MQTTDGTPLTDQPQRATGPSRRRVRLLAVALAVTGLALDVLSKVWAVSALPPGVSRPLLGPVLSLRLIRNPGAAFSLGESITPVFTILAAAVLLFLIIGLLPRLGHRGWAVAIGLLMAGVAGNLTDRLFRSPGPLHGHVVDFLELPHWPIFNVADICVSSAAVLIVVLSLWGKRGLDGKAHPERSAEPSVRDA